MGFGSRTTAAQVLSGVDLTGKTAIVTGGSSGIGTETVRSLASAGARVVFSSRNLEAGNKVAADVSKSGVKGAVVCEQLDLADLASVEQFAGKVAVEPRIDYLICNAGVMACPFSLTKDGFEMQIGTNHFGHFQLVRKLTAKLKAQEHKSRIVLLSSTAHEFGQIHLDDMHYAKRKYSAWGSYGQSKLANVLHAKEFTARNPDGHVVAYSVHPGVISTNLGRHMGIMAKAMALVGPLFMKSIPQGAATTVYAATAPELEGKSGEYLYNCSVQKPSKRGEDLAMATKLWDITEEQIDAKLKEKA